MTPELEAKPKLAPGCRMNESTASQSHGKKSQQPRVLLMPERALRLNGPSLEIVSRCDGKHTVRQIITELQKLYAKAEPERVEKDILGYLGLLHEQRALDFE
ncbi:MAG: pyrroloquinoline quinone biosynthesis protein PqqD [Acidobacteria bacterium 13_1_40CM_2_60_7]|nr:MAG: pyrroloquinoline quinone biosynthesis protein PqqD [Acidobacteria bacterium 13_1_40CM_4_61_5]OLD62130.1 MAG: pyrroloquinoline quinone biosynthesis protein PqqD [Acidobacteria bacterium 13_1_40CM_2_60_7]OLE82983.1 MAG: pyrroloquinoline quinone biosynthesis protein PqqD [Acidobacteria bacterium 13_1_20CM_2_60_10]